MKNDLKQKLGNLETCIGAWLTIPSMAVAEAMASCGFDWMVVDMEHGAASVDQAQAAFVAAERRGVAAMARLPSADPYLGRRLLDAGAVGLIVPVVEEAAAFSEFASHCRYPPAGRRGVGLSRCNAWGGDFDSYMREFEPVLVAQIETRAGVAAAREIAAIDGLDALFLGPYDLSGSLGEAGNFDTPEYREAVEEVAAACRENSVAPGIHQVEPDPAELKKRIAEGFRFIAYGTDALALRLPFKDLSAILESS